MAVLHDPVEGDKTIVQPVELEQDGEQHDDRGVDKECVERAFERDGVFEQGYFDGDPFTIRSSFNFAEKPFQVLLYLVRLTLRIERETTGRCMRGVWKRRTG
jgi:hypothetical protein